MLFGINLGPSLVIQYKHWLPNYRVEQLIGGKIKDEKPRRNKLPLHRCTLHASVTKRVSIQTVIKKYILFLFCTKTLKQLIISDTTRIR